MALPQEIEWNIIKFMSHPCADILRPIIEDFDSYDFSYRTHLMTIAFILF